MCIASICEASTNAIIRTQSVVSGYRPAQPSSLKRVLSQSYEPESVEDFERNSRLQYMKAERNRLQQERELAKLAREIEQLKEPSQEPLQESLQEPSHPGLFSMLRRRFWG